MNEHQLRQLSDAVGDAWMTLTLAAHRWNIDTPLRQAHWLAQLAHESAGFMRLVENLNYRAEALVRTFPSRFPDMSVALAYSRKPQAIANRAYSNRMGNGDEASGDGWRYRGRGYVQLTGRDNYLAASMAVLGHDGFVREPELVEQPQHAAQVAGWFWDRSKCNHYADHDDIHGVSGLINRGDAHKKAHGMADRMLWLDRAKRALGLPAAAQA